VCAWWAVICVAVPARADVLEPLPPQPAGAPWPTAEWAVREPGSDVDRAKLDAIVAELFRPTGRAGVHDTRALVIVRGGAIVLERYAPGFDAGSRFYSWSMAKSVTQALVGLRVRDGGLALDARADVPEWSGADDPRRAITLRQLLHMSSGIANGDREGGGGDIGRGFGSKMLFGEGARDMAAYAAAPPLASPPGTHWAYSTATSVLLARCVERSLGGTVEAARDFARRELFERIGMKSALLERDAQGTFVGGASVWASARDWARFGLLYLRDGVWDSARVLPEGWVDFTRTPAPAPDNGSYGAHFWLARPPGPGQFAIPQAMPADSFQANGANGQLVSIIPSRDLLIVRLGEQQASSWPWINEQVAALANLFPVRAGRAP
jgi:CubicO group peptidase (beta-lactamase class C family)